MLELSIEYRKFASQLAAGPAFLLLGQRGTDELAQAVADYRWNGVYTSATGPEVARAFANSARTSTSLGPVGRTPSRSQDDLEVRYLFGGTHLPESERPPTSVVEQATARVRSNQELARLVSETVTPRGTVVIDGWEPGDLLESSDVAPLLAQLGGGQAHLFSAGAWRNDPLIESFASAGRIVLHDEGLGVALEALRDGGAIKEARDDATSLSRHVIPLGQGFVDVDIHTWNQVRRSARPVDLELMTPPVFSSDAARYQEFRNFVGATEGVPSWRGLAAEMNLKRDFEAGLLERVATEIRDRELPAPIVLAGQTATGKSVALASLALRLSQDGEVAVLHQSRRSVRPSVDDVEMYSAWAEERGARATVFIWDGMVDPSEYEGFSRQLHARGRKVLVIGSAYKTKSDSATLITAPPELSAVESSRLRSLLGAYGIEVVLPRDALDTSFLAFLYRTLPETESKLRTGLASEMRAAERSMASLARERGQHATEQQRLTAMQAAFQQAGLALEDLLPPDLDDELVAMSTFAERAPIQRVTTLVLVAGRNGIPVPIDLALRILGREGYQSVRDALRSSDILREIDDDSGEIYLGTRSQLEAELLAQHEIPLAVEIEVVVEAIRRVRVTEGFGGGADEVEFLVKLLERIGPASDQSRRYRQYYGGIAEALRERRSETGRFHPRLVLQESNFARDFVHWQQEAGEGTLGDRVASLEINRELLDETLADLTTRGLIRLSLSVELASTLGAIIHEYSVGADADAIGGMGSRLDDVLKAVLDARAVDPGNVYPVDVLAWSTRDAVVSGALSPAERVDRLASAVATLESLDRGSLTERQLANLDNRGAELNRLLSNDEAVWAYLEKLELNSSPAATYFLAQFDAKEGPEGERKALQRLRAATREARADWRCAQLLIDLTWKEITGSRLLFGERILLHLNQRALSEVSRLAADFGDAELPDGYRFLFVRAIAEFEGGNYAEASRLFREVGDLTRQLSKRIYTSYLLADESGNPRTFTGRVENSDTRSGQVWVNELATRVRFEPRLFTASGEFARNQQLPAFYIGFKLSRGPVAEPRSVFRGGPKR